MAFGSGTAPSCGGTFSEPLFGFGGGAGFGLSTGGLGPKASCGSLTVDGGLGAVGGGVFFCNSDFLTGALAVAAFGSGVSAGLGFGASFFSVRKGGFFSARFCSGMGAGFFSASGGGLAGSFFASAFGGSGFGSGSFFVVSSSLGFGFGFTGFCLGFGGVRRACFFGLTAGFFTGALRTISTGISCGSALGLRGSGTTIKAAATNAKWNSAEQSRPQRTPIQSRCPTGILIGCCA